MNLSNKIKKRKFGVTLAVIVLLLIIAIPVAAITWGEPDTQHTNVGAMVVDWPGFGPFQVCSGTLIHPRVFLTAGHCTVGWDEYGVETFWVNFDEYALNEATLLEVESVITHPDYDSNPNSNPPTPANSGYDVGVLVLAEPVTDIEPANLPDEGFLDQLRDAGKLNQGKTKAKFTVVGYGGILDWPPPEITYEDYRRYAVSEYRALLKAWLRLSQNHSTGDGGSCYGDSGGPSFWTEPDGTEILVGVTSWGDSPCVATGFNYRVDIADTLGFIDDVIANLP